MQAMHTFAVLIFADQAVLPEAAEGIVALAPVLFQPVEGKLKSFQVHGQI